MHKLKLLPVTLLTLCFIGFIGGCSSGPATAPAPIAQPTIDVSALGPNVIRITNAGFEPSEITVKVGESITFINETTSIHQPTGGAMYGGGIMPGQKWSFVAEDVETFDFVDYRYPENKGVITVTE